MEEMFKSRFLCGPCRSYMRWSKCDQGLLLSREQQFGNPEDGKRTPLEADTRRVVKCLRAGVRVHMCMFDSDL
jgi:hypothetical protein